MGRSSRRWSSEGINYDVYRQEQQEQQLQTCCGMEADPKYDVGPQSGAGIWHGGYQLPRYSTRSRREPARSKQQCQTPPLVTNHAGLSSWHYLLPAKPKRTARACTSQTLGAIACKSAMHRTSHYCEARATLTPNSVLEHVVDTSVLDHDLTAASRADGWIVR